MKPKLKHGLPLDLSLLCVFYVINALLCLISSLTFFAYLDIIIIGKAAYGMPAFLVRALLITIPLYIAFGLRFLRKESWFLAICYHLFFMTNGIVKLFCIQNPNTKLNPFLEITLKPEYKAGHIDDLLTVSFKTYLIQVLGVVIGLSIIIYLFKKRDLFKL